MNKRDTEKGDSIFNDSLKILNRDCGSIHTTWAKSEGSIKSFLLPIMIKAGRQHCSTTVFFA